MLIATPIDNAGAAAASRSHALMAGPPVASDQLLPNEVWSRIHAFADLPAKSALSEVDTNLRGFALPTAQAYLKAALSRADRYRHGNGPVRRAIQVLHGEFADAAVRDRHVQKLLGLALTIGHDWTDRKALALVHTALCDVLHHLPAEQARNVLANLVVLHQRACAAHADTGRNQSFTHEQMSKWRIGLQTQYEQMRAADTAGGGVLPGQVWRRLEARVAQTLATADESRPDSSEQTSR